VAALQLDDVLSIDLVKWRLDSSDLAPLLPSIMYLVILLVSYVLHRHDELDKRDGH
jgi:hypothetical protein